MAINKIYSIYDMKSESYGPLMAYPTDGVAIREFEQIATSEGIIKKFPDDYSLHHLGEYESSTGEIIPSKTAHVLSRASEFKQSV